MNENICDSEVKIRWQYRREREVSQDRWYGGEDQRGNGPFWEIFNI